MVLSVNVNLERQGTPTQGVPTLTSVPPCYLLILMDRVELLPCASTCSDPIDVNAREDRLETPTLSPDALVPPNASLIITVQTTHFATEQPASVRMRVWQPFVVRMQSAFLADIRDTVSVGLVLQEIQMIRCMDVNHHVTEYFAQMVRPVSSALRVTEFVSATTDWLATPGREEHVLLTTRVLYKDLAWKDRTVSMEFVSIAATLVDVEWEPSVTLIATDVNACLSMLGMPTSSVSLPIRLLLSAILAVGLKHTASMGSRTNVSVIKDTLEILTGPVPQYRSVTPCNADPMQSVSKDPPLWNASVQLGTTGTPTWDVKTSMNASKETHVEQVQTASTSSARSSVPALLGGSGTLSTPASRPVQQTGKEGGAPSLRLALEDWSATGHPARRETPVERTPSALLTTLVSRSTRRWGGSVSTPVTPPSVDPMPTASLTIIVLIVSVTNLSLEMLGTSSMAASPSPRCPSPAHQTRLAVREQSADQSMGSTLASILVKMFSAVPMQDVKLMGRGPSVPVSTLDWTGTPSTFSMDASPLPARLMLGALPMRHALESLTEETTV